MHLTEIVDLISNTDSEGKITIKALSNEQISKLDRLLLWTSPNPEGDIDVTFGDDSWYPPKFRDNRIPFEINVARLSFEIKASALCLLSHGEIEGGSPLKWSTVLTRTCYLARLARYIALRGYQSFRELAGQPEIKIRNLLKGFIHAPIRDNGFGTGATVQFTGWLNVLIKQKLLTASFKTVYIEEVAKLDRENTVLSYPVIPTGVVKKLIAETSSGIKAAEQLMPLWEEINDRYIDALIASDSNTSSQKNLGSIVADICGCKRAEWVAQFEPMIGTMEHLKGHVYAQVLVFTGMRKEEVLALQNDAAKKRHESDKFHYNVRSVLTKTDEASIELNWVANSDVYLAVTVLSRLNRTFIKRAEALLKYRRHNLSEHSIHKLEWGLRENKLFSCSVSSLSSQFSLSIDTKNTKLDICRYQIPLEEKDIFQLEQLGCNFISSSGKNRGIPYVSGDTFKFSAHKFRHTFAWFIVANRLGDLDDIKYQFKHLAEAMTLVYTNRALDSLEELSSIVEAFEEKCNNDLVNELVELGKQGKLSGGGGQRIIANISNLAIAITDASDDISNSTPMRNAHFHTLNEYVIFLKKNLSSIRGLPHGLCTAGPSCKIKNAADPSECVYCSSYIVSSRHMPHWHFVEREAMARLNKLELLPIEQQHEYEALAISWRDNLYVAKKFIAEIVQLPRKDIG
jgi:hypothetical protein